MVHVPVPPVGHAGQVDAGRALRQRPPSSTPAEPVDRRAVRKRGGHVLELVDRIRPRVAVGDGEQVVEVLLPVAFLQLDVPTAVGFLPRVHRPSAGHVSQFHVVAARNVERAADRRVEPGDRGAVGEDCGDALQFVGGRRGVVPEPVGDYRSLGVRRIGDVFVAVDAVLGEVALDDRPVGGRTLIAHIIGRVHVVHVHVPGRVAVHRLAVQREREAAHLVDRVGDAVRPVEVPVVAVRLGFVLDQVERAPFAGQPVDAHLRADRPPGGQVVQLDAAALDLPYGGVHDAGVLVVQPVARVERFEPFAVDADPRALRVDGCRPAFGLRGGRRGDVLDGVGRHADAQ